MQWIMICEWKQSSSTLTVKSIMNISTSLGKQWLDECSTATWLIDLHFRPEETGLPETF